MENETEEKRTAQPRARVALHIGAGAVSMLVAEPDNEGGLETVDFLEQPAPVARDVFRFGKIGAETTERIVEIIRGFGEALAELGLDPQRFDRAVATNIINEAANSEAFLTRIRIGCGIGLEMLDDGEMTRLIYLKTRRRLHDIPAMRDHVTLVLHVGPGNTRALLFERGAIVRYTSYRLGTHRTGEAVESSHAEGEALLRLIREHASGNLNQLRYDYRDAKIQEIVAIGHELQTIRRFAIPHPGVPLPAKALRKLASKAARMTDHEMVRKFQIDYRTAESLLPALVINLSVAESLGLKRMLIPASDYERGLSHDLLVSRGLAERGLAREVLRSARILAGRYQSDPRHGRHVARLASRLFEGLADLHQLPAYDSLLLEVAALLHEVGSFISPRAHHKHSEYIIQNSEIFGLDRRDVAVIALVARYHRHSGPRLGHRAYRDLPIDERVRVAKLASILRVADALDRPHDQRAESIEIRLESDRLVLRLPGVADAAVERLAMQSKADLFAQIFGRKVIVEEG